MNIKKFTHCICAVLAFGLTAVAMYSCTEDNFELPDYTLSGEDVTLTVAVDLPVMSVQSRASLDQPSLNQVESLWVRTYNSQTGLATSEWYKYQPNTTDSEVPHEITLRTKSGASYIVAVANVDNLGVVKGNLTAPKKLSELLEEAATWQQFLDIAVISPSTFDAVRAPVPPLPMAGCYSDLIVGGAHPEPARLDEWQTKNFQSYFIPAQKDPVTFSGAIHLRRLVSHLNFNIIPGNDNIEITVNSYQVMSAPRFSWLYERAGDLTNFGDQATSEDAANYYVDVPQFGSQFITENNDGSSSFDFWQGENKHTGSSTRYSDRDHKSPTNNSHFTSLTGETWSANNEASYLLVSCTVDYKNVLNVNNEGQIVSGGTEVYRSGEVTYLIHLGYINGTNDSEKSADFNCYRNVDYTYNVIVNGIDDIRVDAHATDETYHGEEGMVVDLSYSTIDIDGHYAAFNIQLTQAELSAENFGFIITTYDNGIQYTVTDANEQQGSGQNINIIDDNGNVIDPKYYNWIELRPTTGANVLAQYRPRFGANADGATFLLTSLKGGWNNMTTAMRSTSGFYTVFVNEYTYEPMYIGTDRYANEEWDGSGRPNWMSYVNQNPRRFYIRVTQSVSPDKNSIYARSKYGVSQQSLMTYYSDQNITAANGNIPAGTAIAIERENETEGMNLRHSFAGGTSTSNGRWNTAQFLNGSATEEEDLTINQNNANDRLQWSNYLDVDQPMQVGAVTGQRAQGGPDIPARTIANGNPIKLPKPVTYTGSSDVASTFNDPQANTTYTIEAINACMNRNRDNNGNGRIEPDELRWFVPAMDNYLQMVVGKGSLPEPMMDYARIAGLPLVNTSSHSWAAGSTGTIDNSYYSRYMFISSNSDRCVMWGVEGTSTSQYSIISSWAGTNIRPWQVRCIRNLGSDMRTVAKDDKVHTAYDHDSDNHTFKMSYYDMASIRSNRYVGNGTAATQMPIHTINSPYNSVYYGFEYSTIDVQIPPESRPTSVTNGYDNLRTYINGNPCASVEGLTGTGWRIPNQVELTIMRNAGLIPTTHGSSAAWLSCTVNYFNFQTGVGSSDTTGKLYLIVLPEQGSQLTNNNIGGAGSNLYIRCVRDVN